MEAGWIARRRVSSSEEGDPPLTRFVVEQLSTAHWFDQRETRRLLHWRPLVSVDDGLAALADAFSRHQSVPFTA